MPIGCFLLGIASKYGRLDSFQELLNHDAIIDGSVIEMVISCLDEYLIDTTKNQQKGRIQILEYLIKIGATRKVYEHCQYGKCHSTWLCARVGAPQELKMLLEDSNEGLNFCYGE